MSASTISIELQGAGSIKATTNVVQEVVYDTVLDSELVLTFSKHNRSNRASTGNHARNIPSTWYLAMRRLTERVKKGVKAKAHGRQRIERLLNVERLERYVESFAPSSTNKVFAKA